MLPLELVGDDKNGLLMAAAAADVGDATFVWREKSFLKHIIVGWNAGNTGNASHQTSSISADWWTINNLVVCFNYRVLVDRTYTNVPCIEPTYLIKN